jgi:Gas vesicle synthesis protein GvpL/GvpF
VIEIYAITDQVPERLPPDANLSAVHNAGLAALCAPVKDEELSPALLWQREAIIEALMQQCNLLPARYGTRVEDEAAAAQALAERRAELFEALERVRGAVELSVRVLGDESKTDAPARSGTDYLQAKARRATAEAETAGGVHHPLARLARASTHQGGRAARELLRGAYLVDREAVDRFVYSVGQMQQANPHLQLLCTGPWPPYSFSGA